MNVAPIDFEEKARSRIAQQYLDKRNFVSLATGLCWYIQDRIDNPLSDVMQMYDIDYAEGHNLDVIGDIVGQKRVLTDYSLLEFFGFDGAVGAGTFGDLDDPSVGARFISEGEDTAGSKELSDPEYRLFIKARIIKNHSRSNAISLVDAVKTLTGAKLVRISESSMSLDVGVFGNIADNDLALIQTHDIMPRPAGVEISGVSRIKLLSFNSTNAAIIYPFDPAYSLGSHDFDLSFSIFKHASSFGSYVGTSLFQAGSFIIHESGGIIGSSWGMSSMYAQDALTQDDFNRVRAVRVGNEMSLYINGKKTSSAPMSEDLGGPSLSFCRRWFPGGISAETIHGIKLIVNGAVAINSSVTDGAGLIVANDGTGGNGIVATDATWVSTI